jgi:hypothetical protein
MGIVKVCAQLLCLSAPVDEFVGLWELWELWRLAVNTSQSADADRTHHHSPPWRAGHDQEGQALCGPPPEPRAQRA